MEEEYNLHSKFDIEKHMKTYKNYCEVVILPSGEIQYAVPSHQEKLISLMNRPREEIMNMIPREYYCDVLDWLLMQTKCISVWSEFYKGEVMTVEQQESLDLLLKNNLTRKWSK